ncbi:hypothetical protein EA462_08560 [Natrarchaeobius halalkaliphilus]|uniref:Uncharacterized protein n=1 Tax=Natrarchaeobius halalkaliphilus TaxID=1679091 RepID=A0A3N6MX29_9EURY|nr:hypothetical protein [Natrarchaeobius halalkaliphilus]RQG90042.1 hypothetical protein EA462_08560 [Natrarchaeobius halalkaliphilus]
MSQFTCQAHLDEYVIDDDDLGTFGMDNSTITYTTDDEESSISVPISEINDVTFDRDTTLHRFRFLGFFFGILTLVLVAFAYLLAFADPDPGPDQNVIVIFTIFLIIGGVATTRNFFRHENHDVIDICIKTDDDLYTVCGRMGNTNFVEACAKLIESDIPTMNRNSRLESVLDREE